MGNEWVLVTGLAAVATYLTYTTANTDNAILLDIFGIILWAVSGGLWYYTSVTDNLLGLFVLLPLTMLSFKLFELAFRSYDEAVKVKRFG